MPAASLDASLDPALDPALDTALDAAYDAAVACWSDLHVPRPLYRQFLLGRLVGAAEDTAAHCARLNHRDLYVVCGCVADLAPAWHLFRTTYLGALEPIYLRLGFRRDHVPDLQQQLWVHLAVRQANGTINLDRFKGEGSLCNWLRVAAVRLALRCRRNVSEDARYTEEVGARQLETVVLPSLDGLESEQWLVIDQVVSDVVSRADAEDRLLLRQYYLDRLTLEQIACIAGTHRSTVLRRLERVEGILRRAVRGRLRAELRVQNSTLDSIIRSWLSTVADLPERLLGP